MGFRLDSLDGRDNKLRRQHGPQGLNSLGQKGGRDCQYENFGLRGHAHQVVVDVDAVRQKVGVREVVGVVVVLSDVKGNLFAAHPPAHVVLVLREHFHDGSGPGTPANYRYFRTFAHHCSRDSGLKLGDKFSASS